MRDQNVYFSILFFSSSSSSSLAVSMHRRCYVWHCLTEFSGIVPSCFTLSHRTIFHGNIANKTGKLAHTSCLCWRQFFGQYHGSGKVWIVFYISTLKEHCSIGISPMGNSGRFPPGKSQLRQSRATQPQLHAGCFSVSIIHRTLTRTTGSLTCAQMLMHAIAHGRWTDTIEESVLKVDSRGEKKIPCRTGESNLRQRRADPTLK